MLIRTMVNHSQFKNIRHVIRRAPSVRFWQYARRCGKTVG